MAERRGQPAPSLAGVRDPATGQWRKTGKEAATTETAPLDLAEVMRKLNEVEAAVKGPKTAPRQASRPQPAQSSSAESWARAAIWIVAILAAAAVIVLGVYFYGAYVVYYGR